MAEKEVNERKNILWVLEESLRAVKKEDVGRLKELSNHTLHTAAIYQDPDSLAIAVIIYSLSKIIERKKYSYYDEWPSFYRGYIKHIERAILCLKREDFDKFRDNIRAIEKDIRKLSGNFKRYLQEVFRKAEINKASRLYEHGISMEQTAKLLGITIWELAEYAGQTGIADVNLGITLPVKERIKQAEEIFEA